MALEHAAARCLMKNRKPLGIGCDRIAYYSPLYDRVFKRPRSRDNEQHKSELALIKRMNEKEKTVFPVDTVLEVKGVTFIVMRKCEVLTKAMEHDDAMFIFTVLDRIGSRYYSDEDRESDNQTMAILYKKYHLDFSTFDTLTKFILRYDLYDLHPANLGIFENRIVIIDCGLRG